MKKSSIINNRSVLFKIARTTKWLDIVNVVPSSERQRHDVISLERSSGTALQTFISVFFTKLNPFFLGEASAVATLGGFAFMLVGNALPFVIFGPSPRSFPSGLWIFSVPLFVILPLFLDVSFVPTQGLLQKFFSIIFIVDSEITSHTTSAPRYCGAVPNPKFSNWFFNFASTTRTNLVALVFPGIVSTNKFSLSTLIVESGDGFTASTSAKNHILFHKYILSFFQTCWMEK